MDVLCRGGMDVLCICGLKDLLAQHTASVTSDVCPYRRVFSEVASRSSAFSPSSMLDFGAGPGAALWALMDTVAPGRLQNVSVPHALCLLASQSPCEPAFGRTCAPVQETSWLYGTRCC